MTREWQMQRHWRMINELDRTIENLKDKNWDIHVSGLWGRKTIWKDLNNLVDVIDWDIQLFEILYGVNYYDWDPLTGHKKPVENSVDE